MQVFFIREKKEVWFKISFHQSTINLKIKNAWFCIKNLHTQNKTSFRQKKLWQILNPFSKQPQDISISLPKTEFLASNHFSTTFPEPTKTVLPSNRSTISKSTKNEPQLPKERSSQKKSSAVDPKHFMTSLLQMRTEL